MRSSAIKCYEAFKRAKEFGITYSSAFPAGSYGSNQFSALSDVVKELDNYFHSQITHMNAARGKYDSKAVVKAALLEQLKLISRYARIISKSNPGMAANFDLRGKLKEQEILSVAKSFAENGALYRQQFLDHDMPPDFLTDLNELIVDYEESINSSANATSSQTRSTAGIDEGIDKGMDILENLDVVIEGKFSDDKMIMQTWRTARHIERTRRTPKPDTTSKEEESSKPEV